MKSKITDFKSACKFLKRSTALPDVSMIDKKHREYIINHYKLLVQTEALNLEQTGKEYKPDYTNSNEGKYIPWFEVKANKKHPAGSGFSCTLYVGWGADAVVGSRLCFPSSELALYSAKKWEKQHIINQLM